MTGLSGLFLKYDSHPDLKCGVGQDSNSFSSASVGRILTPASMPFVDSGPVPLTFHSSKTPAREIPSATQPRLGQGWVEVGRGRGEFPIRFCTSGSPRAKSSNVSVPGLALYTEKVR